MLIVCWIAHRAFDRLLSHTFGKDTPKRESKSSVVAFRAKFSLGLSLFEWVGSARISLTDKVGLSGNFVNYSVNFDFILNVEWWLTRLKISPTPSFYSSKAQTFRMRLTALKAPLNPSHYHPAKRNIVSARRMKRTKNMWKTSSERKAEEKPPPRYVFENGLVTRKLRQRGIG